ncbi:MAG: hypothetical protein WC343_02650, partial [Bacilli bacterium]
MKGKRKNSLFLILIGIIIVIVSITLYIIFNPLNSKGDVRLNLFEQQWIEKNKNTIINVLMPTGVPIYSYEGEGVAFSFLVYFEGQTELEFNKTPYIIDE